MMMLEQDQYDAAVELLAGLFSKEDLKRLSESTLRLGGKDMAGVRAQRKVLYGLYELKIYMEEKERERYESTKGEAKDVMDF